MRQVTRRGLAILAVVHLAMAALFLFDRAPGTRAALAGLPLDDGWIHLVYARSFGHLHGFAYNPGQAETGFTSPLWVMLLSPLFWLPPLDGPRVVVAVKLVGVALAFAGSLFAFRLTLRLGAGRAAAWAAALLYAVDPSLGFARVSGMEVILATVVMLWACVCLAEERARPAGVALALAPLARPECALFVVVALPVLLQLLRRQRARAATWALTLAPLAVAAAAWCGYCLAVTGHPLPATFYAKHQRSGLAALADVGVVIQMIGGLPWFTLGIGAPLFALGVWRLVRARAPVALVVVAYALLAPLATAWAHDLRDWWPFYWNRYFMPAIPFLLVPLAAGIGVVAGEAAARRLVPATAGLALVLMTVLAWPWRLRAAADLFAMNCQNIDEMQVALGGWLAAHAAPDDVVATNDAGAIRFVSGRRVLDLVGLNNHEVLFGDRRQVVALMRPRYFVVFPSLFPALAHDPRFAVVTSVHAERYTICNCDQDRMIVLERRR